MSYEGPRKFFKREHGAPREIAENFIVDPIRAPRERAYRPKKTKEGWEEYSDDTSSFHNSERTPKDIAVNTAIIGTASVTGMFIGFEGAHFLIRGSMGIAATLSKFTLDQGLSGLIATLNGVFFISSAGAYFLGGAALICLSGLIFRLAIKKLKRRA